MTLATRQVKNRGYAFRLFKGAEHGCASRPPGFRFRRTVWSHIRILSPGTQQLYITQEYLKLKLQELYLVHEHREKVEEERQEQREIRERLREEEKAAKEIEKAQKDAERDEETKSNALEKAKRELAQATGKQMDRLQALVDRLEAELKDALERKAKAIARAQLTRSGHVYVLSNVGSFGEGVFKIGLTRRLEPLERVDELGDASVPFRYDVHAMIYSEDAPLLEATLHKHFESRRVNMVNLRREFFRVTLDEIREAVSRHFGEVTFRTVPEAEEFRKTVAMRNDATQPVCGPGEATSTHPVRSSDVDLLSIGGPVRPPQGDNASPAGAEIGSESSTTRTRRNVT
ncbi:MAG TPA: GIY-YIG nuclease family protein [Pirellulales bacterium]|nr:GIY-YIG nuclease family protein [Pirellulales bacterium]